MSCWCPSTEAVAASENDDRNQLTPLTVSASKGSMPLSQLNAAVIVIERDALEQSQLLNTLDLASLLPGVQMSESGSQLFPVISLRGISSAQDFYNPALTVYLDGVPQLPVFSAQTLLNVARIELLKGPQGTLYGKSAEGGVLNLVSVMPEDTPERRLRSGLSSRGGYLAQVASNGALLPELLYGSLALSQVNAAGQLYNPVTAASNQGGTRSSSAVGKLRLAPRALPWQLDLSVARDCSLGSQDAYVPFDHIHDPSIYIASGVAAAYAQFRQQRCSNSYALAGHYHWSDWQLSMVAAWQSVAIARQFPYAAYFSQQPEQWRQNLQEIRLASHAHASGNAAAHSAVSSRAWDAVFGLYRQAVQQTRNSSNTLVTPYILQVFSVSSDNHTKSLAAYGDITWHLSPALDLSAGLRLSQDQAWTSFNGSALDPSLDSTSFADVSAMHGVQLLGKLSAGYVLHPGWRLYANLAQGYKPGGFNLAPSSLADAQGYGAERAISYELGLRLTARQWRGTLALYQVKTRDIQLYSSNRVGYQSLHNIGDSRSTGIEFALQWQATRHWKLGLDGFLNHANFSRYLDPYGCRTCSGKRLPFAPPAGLNLQLQGQLPLGHQLLRPQLALRWLAAQYFDTANSLRQSSYFLLDAVLGWHTHSGIALSLYGRNLNQRAYRSGGFRGGSLGNFAQPGMARTVGLNLSYDY